LRLSETERNQSHLAKNEKEIICDSTGLNTKFFYPVPYQTEFSQGQFSLNTFLADILQGLIGF
jgi:hypothetical protein